MTPIVATPSTAPFPVEIFLNPSTKEQSDIALITSESASGLLCSIPVRVGLFFDGTNNNLERDRNGERIGVPDIKTGKPAPIARKPLTPDECSHSNVARLFAAFPGQKRQQGYYPYYIAGVGTPFKEIGEPAESADGKAFALGGLPRIIWGLIHVLNSLHRTVTGGKQPLYTDDKTGQLAKEYEKEVGRSQTDIYGQQHTVTHCDWFEPHIAKLKAKLAASPKPTIPSLTIYVFGFSRGAAQAAAFCHLFNDLLQEGRLAGIPASISFLGVFDTVATVGASGSMSSTLPLPDALFDGHWSWAKRILNPLPDCVKKGLHLIAAHEQRMNFPVTVLSGVAGLKQMYVPGVHSDVGGGYAPGDQGKGRGAQAAMLSQIPLVLMFKEARLAGVPLLAYSELEERDKMDFEISPELASAWNAYTAELGSKGNTIEGHMALYYRWRAARLYTLESTSSFQAADPQSQQDLRESNHMLVGDLDTLRVREKGRPDPSDNTPAYRPSDASNISQVQFIRANSYTVLNEWETWAFSIFKKAEPLPSEVLRFFDDYVHDSMAGFYLAGDVTEYDKRCRVTNVMQKDPAKLSRFDKKVYDKTVATKAAQKKKADGQELNAEEKVLVDEAEYGTPFPIMTDEDTSDLRNPLIRTQTNSRREGGGYLLRRGYYPHNGFIFRTDPLEERPVHRKVAAQKENLDLAWSDDVIEDSGAMA